MRVERSDGSLRVSVSSCISRRRPTLIAGTGRDADGVGEGAAAGGDGGDGGDNGLGLASVGRICVPGCAISHCQVSSVASYSHHRQLKPINNLRY